MKRFFGICVLLACLLCGFAAAEEEERVIEMGALTATLSVQNAAVEIHSTCIDGEEWLFLPAFADMDTMALSLDGQPVLWQDVQQEEEGVWLGQAVCGEEMLFDLRAMRSENLRALFLFSDDPDEHGREYIENCERHVNQTTGAMAIVAADGTLDHADALRQLRGRGNSTWGLTQKPYQFKLEHRADLLQTGDPSEENRTWNLLADAENSTFLQNKIALDMGLELGIQNTSHSEFVDLYYDGEYRGLYLLTEKVEAGRGRLEVESADKVIAAINSHVGITDIESLDVKTDRHPMNGDYYSYVDGMVEPEDPSSVTYVLEMEGEATTLSDPCWFHLSDTSVIASKNPERASQRMMLYVSTRLEEALQTLLNGGVNPQNGRTIHDDFDVDAFARILLVNEFYYNSDNYTYSSSWFILPEGQTRFIPGTLWDFNLGMHYCRDGSCDRGVGLRAMKDWPLAFYHCDAFAEAMQRIYLEEISPVVEKILLGTQEGKYLKPLNVYEQHIEAARHMNEKIWPFMTYSEFHYGRDHDEEMELLRSFLTDRHTWLKQELENASPYTADGISLWGYAEYGHVDKALFLQAAPWSNVEILNASWEKIAEATEEDYAVWQLEAFIAPEAGYAFETTPRITFGGREISYEEQADGSLRILVTFEDPTYRPVDYYGEDIGMIYQPDVYASNYPEIAAEYEDDPQGLMDYFCDEGMYEDHMGNAFFKPSEMLEKNRDLEDVLGTDWQLYYWEFLAYGYTDGWLQPGRSRGFGLDVADAL